MPESEQKEQERPLLGPRAFPALASRGFLPEGCLALEDLPPSVPPSFPVPPSLPLPLLPLSSQRCWRGVARTAAGNSCPRPAPLPRLRLTAPTSRLSEFQNSGGRPLENRSRRDAFRRPHPAGTDLLISRTAGRRELNCCLPLLLSGGWWLVF